MKTEIWVSFNYGGWSIWFTKEFELPFMPMLGMTLMDQVGDFENDIRFVNHDYCTTEFYYRTGEDHFSIDVRNIWKRPVINETVDDILEIFDQTNWKRRDSTDIDSLKELMNKDAKR